MVTLEYAFVVPSRTEGYTISIKQGDVWYLEGMSVQPGATTVLVSLTGQGTQSYDLYIDGEYFATEKVDFEPHD